MSDTFNDMEHTFVTVKHPTAKRGEGWDGPFDIILHTGERVWIHGSYSHELTPEILQVGDGTPHAYDRQGNCVFSVPAAWCKYYTGLEAEDIMQAMDDDDTLMGHAGL
jgi:hypothetical protein